MEQQTLHVSWSLSVPHIQCILVIIMNAIKTVRRPLIRTEGLRKSYHLGKATVQALADVDLDIYRGEYVAISGPSGCGKSTLLAMIGALDRPTAGKVLINHIDLSQLDDNDLAEMRGRIGFVFQFFNLMPNLNVRENVELSMSVTDVPRAARRRKAAKILEMVGLGERTDHTPSELSGGEQQRAAIARALARDPEFLLLDEPTGNLDSKNTQIVLGLLRDLHRSRGTTIVLITHVRSIAQLADRTFSMVDGRMVFESQGYYSSQFR